MGKGTSKSFATSPPIELARLKEVKDMIPGATVNDALMTVLTMCLRLYYEKYEPEVLEGSCCSNPKVRGNFPISLRGVDPKYKNVERATNAFSQGQMRFPVHLEDPRPMLQHVKAQIDNVKISPEPILRDRILGALASLCMPRCPVLSQRLIIDQFGKVTAMLSNVVGPAE